MIDRKIFFAVLKPLSVVVFFIVEQMVLILSFVLRCLHHVFLF